MTKPKRKGWPIRMYAVCYRDSQKKPSWVPYSESLYHYRDQACCAAAEIKNSCVMVVWVHPTSHIRLAHNDVR